MPRNHDQLPEQRPDRQAPDAPRTDPAPEGEPYSEGSFGTEEEEGVVREEDESGDAARTAAEDAAGGDREI